MKQLILLFTTLLTVSLSSLAQTATDFTADDCDGVSHNLFSELDAGKVIVMVWVMPCNSCASYALEAYAAANSYATSNPGKVQFYIVDDVGNTTCNTLETWANNYSMSHVDAFFSNSSISMTDYGTAGMPKVVVLSGSDHHVYFNENSSTTGIQSAVDQAVANSAGVEDNVNEIELSIFPNPATSELTVNNVSNQGAKISIYDASGAEVESGQYSVQPNAGGTVTVNIVALETGNYVLKLVSENATQTAKFVVVR